MILRICQYGAAHFARGFFAFVRRAADGAVRGRLLDGGGRFAGFRRAALICGAGVVLWRVRMTMERGADRRRRGGFSARLGARRMRAAFGALRVIYAARRKVRRAEYRGGRGRRGCAFSRGARRSGEAAAFWGARRLWLNFRAWLTITAGIMNFAALKGACL